jgi:hypothetical protein
MRFRFFLLSLSVLYAYSQAGRAQEVPLPLKLDRTFKRLPENTEATPTFITADRVEAKQGQVL